MLVVAAAAAMQLHAVTKGDIQNLERNIIGGFHEQKQTTSHLFDAVRTLTNRRKPSTASTTPK